MEDVPKDRWLHERREKDGTRRYYLRARVPRELIPVLRKREIKKSLETADRNEALTRLAIEAAEVRMLFDVERRRLRDTPTVTLGDAQIRQIVRAWFGETEKAYAQQRVSAGVPDESSVENRITDLSGDEAELLGREEGWAPAVHGEVKVLLDRHCARLEPNSDAYRRMCQFVRQGMIEGVRREQARLKGNFSPSFDKFFSDVDDGSTVSIPTDKPSIDVASLIDLFSNSPERQQIRKKTRLDFGMVFRLLKETWGEAKPVRDITRSDARKIRDILHILPPNATKRFKGMSLKKAAAMARAKGLPAMSAATANGALNRISTLFKWAVREEYADKNPAEGLRVSGPQQNKRDARHPFSVGQLKKIFSAPIYTGCKDDGPGYAKPGPNHPRRSRFWVSLIALFTGLRQNEICQLLVTDIESRDGVTVIVNRAGDDNGEKRVKSMAGWRFVPVHPELVKIGFLDFVAKQKASGEQRLFPELKPDTRGYFSGNFQKWFNHSLANAGAKAPKTSFHSFRHCFRDALREADVTHEAVLALGGWSTGGEEERYGSGLKPSTLAREIAKIEYDGLDLSHLYPAPGSQPDEE